MREEEHDLKQKNNGKQTRCVLQLATASQGDTASYLAIENISESTVQNHHAVKGPRSGGLRRNLSYQLPPNSFLPLVKFSAMKIQPGPFRS